VHLVVKTHSNYRGETGTRVGVTNFRHDFHISLWWNRPGVLILLACLCLAADAQTSEWTWIGGSSALGNNGGQAGVYGALGTPAAGNAPGGRYAAANWTDSSGNLWLFGGWGYDANGTSGYLNDLWEFNPATSEWVWMSGSNTVGSHGGQPGVYGALGVPAAGNTPGGRNAAASWTDNSGNLWLFGGWAYDANSIAGELNDLWEFNPFTNEWAWMGGSSTVGPHDGQSGVYGTLGVPAAGNTPGGLYDPSSWTDAGGNLWLFGGQGYDAHYIFDELNGLWEFKSSSGEWAWMGGSRTVGSNGGQPGVYGTLGTPATDNIPGSRSDASKWTAGSGNLWLFGGNGYDAGGDAGYLNDLWSFNPAANEWAWMSGSSTVGSDGAQSGVYGTLGTLAAGNVPGGRISASNWTDSRGNLWLFGGYGADAIGDRGYLSDLWEFNPPTNDWAWMGGSSTIGSNGGQSGVYGALGTPAAGNIPGGRDAASSWTDSSGNLWLFGGYGYDATGNYGPLNDLWKYQPTGISLSVATPFFSPLAGTYATAQSVTISDATAGATIYYTTDGTTPTTSSTIYTAAILVSSTETLQAIATASGYSTSALAAATYTITPAPTASPIFSPLAGTYTTAQSVTISDATANATIYYTIDGSTPTTSSTIYTAAIAVSSTETLQAIATASGYSTSAVAAATYTITPISPPAATPIFSPVAGTYTSAQNVAISDATAGATIYYTTNGVTPTTSSTIYTAAITVSSTETLQAIATASGYSTSAVAPATYTITPTSPPAATPIFSPVAGTYTSAQNVAISDATAGATIYYTTDGSTPTTSSTIYTTAITVSSSETLLAIATASGYLTSAVAPATYTITLSTSAFTIGGTAVTVTPGAATGNASTNTVTPSGGFIGNVGLTAVITSSPAGAKSLPTLSFGSTSPVSITSASAGTATLTVYTTAPSTATLVYPARPGTPWYAASGATLACILLIGIPARRRSWRTILGMLALLVAFAGGVLACGGGGSGTIYPGTTPGNYTITVTGTSGMKTATGTISLTVQ
jgi:N-acetylneuraminic acid mutarotase